MRERESRYDILRCIATLGVLMIHVTAKSFVYMNHSFGNMILVGLNGAFRVSVPIFIFISGVMVTLSHKNKPLNYLSFLKKRFTTIYIPYMLVSVVYTLAVAVDYQQAFSVTKILNDILTGSAYAHLYFVPIIVQLILLTPLCLKIKENKWLVLWMIIISYLSVLYIDTPMSDRFFMKYIGFYLIGLCYPAMLGYIKSKVQYIIIVCHVLLWSSYIAVLILLHTNIWYMAKLTETLWYVNGLLTPIAWLVLIDYVKENQVFKWIASFAPHTYWVYLLHPIILAFLTRIYTFSSSAIIVLFLLTLIISFLLSILLGKLKERLLKQVFIKY